MTSEPELVRVRQQQAFESQRGRVEAKLQSGQTLDVYEAIFLSKYYPDVSRQLASEYPAVTKPEYTSQAHIPSWYVPLAPRPEKQQEQKPSHIPTPLELRQRETKEFGQDIGNIKSLIGPGKYGTLTGWFLGRSKEAERFESLMPFGPKTNKGLEATAGFVASGEGLVNPYTPFVLSPSFLIGYGAGVVLIGYGIGKVTKPMTDPFTDWLKEKGSTYLTRRYESAGAEGRLLDWKGPKERLVEILTGGRAENVGPQVVDLPNPFDVTKGKATVTQEFLGESMPSDYAQSFMKGKIIEGEYVSEGLTHELPRPASADLEGFMKGKIVKGEYLGEGLTHELPRPEGAGSLSFSKRITPQITLGAPDSILRFTDTDFVLPPMRGLEAESGAFSFGITGKTALLDPELVSPLENPITKQLFGLPSGLSFLDVASVERASFLPKAIGLAAIVGVQVAGSQYAKSMVRTELLSRNVPKIELLSRSTPSLKSIVDLGSDVSLSPMLASEAVPIQRTMQEPIAKTIQTPRTTQVFPPEFVQLKVPVFPRQAGFNQDFNRFFKTERKKKGAWAKRYIWDFPVKGPEALWKMK